MRAAQETYGTYGERAALGGGAAIWSRTGASGSVTRVLPDGCMDLLLWRGQLTVAGPDTRAQLFAGRDADRVTGLRLAPGQGPAVFGVRAHELRDRRVPLEAVWPEGTVRMLAERVSTARDPGRELESIARRRLCASEDVGPLRGRVVVELRRGRDVAATARAVGLSERQLHRRCREVFGYGPKLLSRVLRLQRALRLARCGTPFAEVAGAAGYADQAHLARETRALAGVPLTELL